MIFSAALVPLLLAVAGPVAPVPEVALQLTFAPAPGEVAVPVSGRIELRALDGATESPVRSVAMKLPGTVSVPVPESSSWQVTVEAPGYWSRPQTVSARPTHPGQSEAQLELWRASQVEGQIEIPAGRPEPKELSVRFRPAATERGAVRELPEILQTCPLKDRRFQCVLPAGRFDLRFRSPGYVSQLRWDRSLPRGESHSVGLLRLVPGASLVGWVEAPDKELRFQDCRVTLEPQTAGAPPSLADGERQSALPEKETPNSRGYFEFSTVPPGQYAVVVRHPRFAPARVVPVTVQAGSETEIRRIVLQPPARLAVRLDPPVDPWGHPWSLDLQQQGPVPGALSPVAQAAASVEGAWSTGNLEPGRYLLKVSGSLRSRWWSEELEVDGDSEVREIRLPVVRVEGQVLLGKKAIRAWIWFGGLHGAVRVPVESDADGQFSLVLPEKADPWRVEVHSSQELHLYGTALEVALAPASERVQRIELRLPDTGVRGEVVDEAGLPVPAARVEVTGANSLDAEADAEGRFEIVGLLPGSISLEASSPKGDLSTSALQSFDLVEGRAIEGTRLVVKKKRELKGLVAGPGGQGVPGALLFAILDGGGPILALAVPQAVTDVAGQFTLRLPAEAGRFHLAVMAPGFALTQVAVDARGTEPLIVPVRQEGGTLIVRYQPPPASSGPAALVTRSKTALLHQAFLWGPMLERWGVAQGYPQGEADRFVIPMLEPGSYTACFDLPWQSFYEGRPPAEAASRCVGGELAPGGELILSLAIPKAESEPGP